MKNFGVDEILKIHVSGDYKEHEDKIEALLKKENLTTAFIETMPRRHTDLSGVVYILQKLLGHNEPSVVLDVLEKSINKKNAGTIIDFISKNYSALEVVNEDITDRMFQEMALDIVKQTLELFPETANKIIELVTSILKNRNFKVREQRYGARYSREKHLVCDVMYVLSKTRSGKRKESVKLAFEHFEFISNYSDLSERTPKAIHRIILDYIIDTKEIEDRFKEVSGLILEQYENAEFYEGKYEGYEWMGGGVSATNTNFTLHDVLFVEEILRPALQEYYDRASADAWGFVNSFCIKQKGGGAISVTAANPDFLLRASVSIVLQQHIKGIPEASEILKKFLMMKKGIPGKSEVIFEMLAKNVFGFSDDQLWNILVLQQKLQKDTDLPVNVFFEKLTLILAEKGNEEAIGLLVSWLKNSLYYDKSRWADMLVSEMVGILLRVRPEQGFNAVKALISNSYFENRTSLFDAFRISNIYHSILEKPELIDRGIGFLQELIAKPALSPNQQIILCNSLIKQDDSGSEDKELLSRLYVEVVWPLLSTKLEEDLVRDYKTKNFGKIFNFLSSRASRESLVQYAVRLAKNDLIEEALSIVKIFINDPDPFSPEGIDPEDPKMEHDEHRRIVEGGEQILTITTVRGWCGWALLQCNRISSREHVTTMIDLSEKLINDDNYFVRIYGAMALEGLVRNRLTVVPSDQGDRKELFFGKDKSDALKKAKRVEKIAFNHLNFVSQQPSEVQQALSKTLASLFGPIRALNEEEARNMLATVLKMNSAVISEFSPIFIFFAVFRKDLYSPFKWQLPGLYDDLEKYDEVIFKTLLLKAMKTDDDTRSIFAWQFRSLVDDMAADDRVEGVDVALEYLNELTDKYSRQAFSDIYLFVDANIEKRFEGCRLLWQKSLKTELACYETLISESSDGNLSEERKWWPHSYNVNVLRAVHEKLGMDEFIKDFKLLVSYPISVYLRGIDDLVHILKEAPNSNEEVSEIFDNLIERSGTRSMHYREAKKEWLK